jgi:hypothetical protein
MDGPYFQRFFVDTYVYLTPDAAFGAAMFAGVPLAFTFGLDPRAIDKEVQWSLGPTIREAHVQSLLAPLTYASMCCRAMDDIRC